MFRGRSPAEGSVQTEPEDLSSQGSGPGGSVREVPSGVWSWRGRSNKLLMFCDIVLKHTNYPSAFKRKSKNKSSPNLQLEGDDSESESVAAPHLPKLSRVVSSPLNSVGESARESTRSSTSSTDSVLLGSDLGEEVDKETFESVSCWCGKPFAGRPMIECDKCLVWFHMSCEAVRRKNIPQHFTCSQCRDATPRKRKSEPKPKKKPPSPFQPADDSAMDFESATPPPLFPVKKTKKTPRTSSPPELLLSSNLFVDQARTGPFRPIQTSVIVGGPQFSDNLAGQ